MQKRPDKDSNGSGEKTTQTFVGLSQHFVDTLGWVITGMWALSMIVNAIPNSGYEPPVTIHVLMTAVATAAFGTNFIKPKNGGSSGNNGGTGSSRSSS